MKREMKKCPFCGGTFVFDENSERKYAEEKIASDSGYAISATCNKCGTVVYAYDHNVTDPTNINQVIDVLYEKVNRRSGEVYDIMKALEVAKLDNTYLEDKVGDMKGRADALEKENARLRNAIVESFINKAVTA